MSLTTLDIVRSGVLPEDDVDFYKALVGSDGLFVAQEGETWDFKESWPFSYSDGYFGGIARLACAFSNTIGGVIVFGVSDSKRTGGNNKIHPNTDKFEMAFRQLTGRELSYKYRHYEDAKFGAIDVILVKRRKIGTSPIRFLSDIASYKKNTLWIRRGSEVREAESRDVPILYFDEAPDIQDVTAVTGQLPPSPATVKSFVGRMSTIDAIFKWVCEGDEPRTFLWGKGGSGKSTIAYEVSRYIKTYGKNLKLGGEVPPDQVIFISGKKQFLNVGSQQTELFLGNDFSDERSMYEAILTLGQFDVEEIEKIDIDSLKNMTKKFFCDNSCFIVIDDIDTLTTAGEEAGLDFLYRVLSKSNKISKLLYTIRNRPTHSIGNSIEVPGLPKADYEDFINICAEQFDVPPPAPDLRDGRLKSISEARPLVLESVIALRRNSGNYDHALALFDQASGEDVRRYVFEREWQALDAADRGREILAILAVYGKRIGFSDLCTISKMEQQKVKDALASVQEMFLIVDHDGDESNYELGQLTKSFVSSESAKLDYYEVVESRVQKFKSTFYADSPEINRFLTRMNRSMYEMRHGNGASIKALFDELSSGIFPPYLSEDPRFLAIRGNVAIFQIPPVFNSARHDFESAFAFKYAPDLDFIRNWFDAEKRSDLADSQTRRIVELVKIAKGYPSEARIEFTSKRASFLYNLARDSQLHQPQSSLDRLFEALKLHLEAYKSNQSAKRPAVIKSEEHTRNTAFFLVQSLIRADDLDRFLTFINESARQDEDWYFDPVAGPIDFLFRTAILQFQKSRKDLQKLLGRLEQMQRNVLKSRFWCNHELLKSFGDVLSEHSKQLKRAIQLAT